MQWGWVSVNVLLPLVLPVILLGIVKFFTSLSLMDTVKDGQLCWFALTLACSMFYDIASNDASAARWPGDLWTLALLGFGGLVCSLVAVLGALFPTPSAFSGSGARLWASHDRVFILSLFFSGSIVIMSTVAHNALARLDGHARLAGLPTPVMVH